ncbi:hypothetical protein NLJ89_g12050 [Agrocybe chaxingu]|uniref:Uncharacterized protein n=1 Tax=Agrocybe chaxingu TaxID=84603 RepID=A0A9W8JNZ1_9AGAR|nr:hypothetical protein NLJ89_g12050 [Agrocybe chaxingu]
MEPILDLVSEATGWKASFIAGGPEPAVGGRLNMISVHSGATSGDVKLTFGRAERVRYKKYIVPIFGSFLQSCYTPDECRSRAIPSSGGDSSLLNDEDLDAAGATMDRFGFGNSDAHDTSSGSDISHSIATHTSTLTAASSSTTASSESTTSSSTKTSMIANRIKNSSDMKMSSTKKGTPDVSSTTKVLTKAKVSTTPNTTETPKPETMSSKAEVPVPASAISTSRAAKAFSELGAQSIAKDEDTTKSIRRDPTPFPDEVFDGVPVSPPQSPLSDKVKDEASESSRAPSPALHPMFDIPPSPTSMPMELELPPAPSAASQPQTHMEVNPLPHSPPGNELATIATSRKRKEVPTEMPEAGRAKRAKKATHLS